MCIKSSAYLRKFSPGSTSTMDEITLPTPYGNVKVTGKKPVNLFLIILLLIVLLKFSQDSWFFMALIATVIIFFIVQSYYSMRHFEL